MPLVRNGWTLVVVLAVGLLLLALNSKSLRLKSKSDSDMDSKAGSDHEVSDFKFLDLEEVEYPPIARDIIDKTGRNMVKDKSVKIKGVNVAYKECFPPNALKVPVLLLHGAAFQAKTWVEQVPTVQTLCHHNYWVVAVDLPGHGNTSSCVSCDRADFLHDLIKTIFGQIKPAIVSPSFSGTYSLPFLQKYQEEVSGFIPVAPVDTKKYSDFLMDNLVVPTLVVYGEKDTGLGEKGATDLVRAIKATQPFILKGARHPAYLDQQDKWHQILLNFLKHL